MMQTLVRHYYVCFHRIIFALESPFDSLTLISIEIKQTVISQHLRSLFRLFEKNIQFRFLTSLSRQDAFILKERSRFLRDMKSDLIRSFTLSRFIT